VAGLAAEERRRMALDLVRDHSAAVLGFADQAEVRLDATFTEMGLGSLMAVELRDRLVSATGLSLPVALIFGYPTPQDVAGELLRRLAADGGAPRSGRGAIAPKQSRQAASEEETDAVARLRSASTEQVLDFIDNELGVS
jgi:acyl carrier protein